MRDHEVVLFLGLENKYESAVAKNEGITAFVFFHERMTIVVASFAVCCTRRVAVAICEEWYC